nr:MFS transporter [Anaerolineae bacterium]
MATRARQPAKGMRTFTIIWIGQLISTLGSGLTGFSLGVWIYKTTGSTTLFATSMLIWFLPAVLFAPLAGVIVDRWDRRTIMILSDSTAGLATLVIGLLYLTGNLAIWHIYLATVIFSMANSLQWPAYSAATSLIVPKDQLPRASGMTQVGDAISSLVSPAIAGLLYVSIGIWGVILIDLLTYGAALVTLLAVRFPQPEKKEGDAADSGTFWEEARYGWVYIRERPGLFGLLVVFAALNFAISITMPLLTPMLLDNSTPDMVGLITSVIGGGMLVGTLVMSAWGGPKRLVTGIYVFETFTGICLLLTGLSPAIVLITAAQCLIAFSMPITNGCSQAIWQKKVAPEVQGRVFSARRMIAFSIIPIAYLLSGPLTERVFEPMMAEGGLLADSLGRVLGVGPGRGIGLLYVIAGVAYALIAQGIMLNKKIRQMEGDLPDAVPAESAK